MPLLAPAVSSSVLLPCSLSSSPSVTWSLLAVVSSVGSSVWSSSSVSGHSSLHVSSSFSSVPSAGVVSAVASVSSGVCVSAHAMSSSIPVL